MKKLLSRRIGVVGSLTVLVLAACGGDMVDVLSRDGSSSSSSGSSGSQQSSTSGEPYSESDYAGFDECSGAPVTWEPTGVGLEISEDGLRVDRRSGGSFDGPALGSVGHRTGKWYFEAELLGSGGTDVLVGIAGRESEGSSTLCTYGDGRHHCTIDLADGSQSGSGGGGGGEILAEDVVGVAADLDEMILYFYVNGALRATSDYLYSGNKPARRPLYPFAELVSGDGFRAAFKTFEYGPPNGFKAWECTE